VLVSSLLTFIETDRNLRGGALFNIADYVFTTLFTIEAALKIVSKNLVFGSRNAYLRDGWNVLDFGTVLISILTLAMPSSGQFGSIRALRSFRTLRPLRLINRNVGMKMAVVTLLRSIPSMVNVLVVCILFYLMFGILGVQLFAGKFYRCDTRFWSASALPAANRTVLHVVDDIFDCMHLNASWVAEESHFDSLPSAMLSLFQMVTLEGWISLMASGIDATVEGKVPRYQSQPSASIFFVLFVVVGAFFTLNLFVSVVIDNYHKNKRAREEQARLLSTIDPMEQDWIDAQFLILKTKPKLNKDHLLTSNVVRRYCYFVISMRLFDLLVVFAILLNAVFMSIDHFGCSEFICGSDLGCSLDALSECSVLEVANIAFTIFFALEFGLKLTAFGPKRHFRWIYPIIAYLPRPGQWTTCNGQHATDNAQRTACNGQHATDKVLDARSSLMRSACECIGCSDYWNGFDLVIVAGSILGIVFERLPGTTVLRIFRIARLVRLIRSATGLQVVAVACLDALP
jgi:hypothetical protein